MGNSITNRAIQQWVETDGKWKSLGWTWENSDERVDEQHWERVAIIDMDKHGHPIKAIFKEIKK